MSYPITNNDSINVINSVKEFCLTIGFPKIIQTDNGKEYKNSLFKDFCEKHSITHIFSSPYHPQTNGVVEVSHKEIRKNLILMYSENEGDNFNLKNSLLEVIYIHNNNIHTSTNHRPIDLINNTNEDIFEEVMNNIKKKLDYKNKNYVELNEGDHIMIKKNCKISGKRLITQRINLRNENIIGTILNNFSGGIYAIRVDESFNNYEEGLELIVNDKQIVYL